jgi:hypothetical protein
MGPVEATHREKFFLVCYRDKKRRHLAGNECLRPSAGEDETPKTRTKLW